MAHKATARCTTARRRGAIGGRPGVDKRDRLPRESKGNSEMLLMAMTARHRRGGKAKLRGLRPLHERMNGPVRSVQSKTLPVRRKETGTAGGSGRKWAEAGGSGRKASALNRQQQPVKQRCRPRRASGTSGEDQRQLGGFAGRGGVLAHVVAVDRHDLQVRLDRQVDLFPRGVVDRCAIGRANALHLGAAGE